MFKFFKEMEELNSTNLTSVLENAIDQIISNYSLNETLPEFAKINKDLKSALDYFLVITTIIIMLGMGSDITFSQIIAHIKKPIGIFIGMVSQFVIMPFLGFSLMRIINDSSLFATSILIISCCPGGPLSNIFSYFIDGDLSLSVTMTTFSTLFALCMMPLNLWIYGRDFEDIVIPYASIAISLAFVTSPVLIGMLIRYWRIGVANVITKIGSYGGAIFIIISIVLQLMLYPDMFKSLPIKIFFVSFFLPSFGMLFGFLTASLFRQPMPIRRTIAIESGMQNLPTALSIIALSFRREFQKGLFVLPFIYGFGSIATFACMLSGYRMYKLYEIRKNNKIDLQDLPAKLGLKCDHDENHLPEYA